MRLIEVVATAQLLAALSPLMTASPSATETALEMVRAYVQEWRIALGAVIAQEHYTQKLEEWPQGRGTFSRRSTQTTRRLISEVLFVRASEHGDWLMFRDVLQVNGERVRDRTSRFDQLFISRPDDVIGGARRIADESARYNLGRLSRNINTPTTTLQFLDAAYSRSTTWTAPKSTKVDGTSAWELTFEQSREPFVIHTPDGEPLPAGGRIWIMPGSSRLLKTELTVVSRKRMGTESTALTARTFTRLVTTFGPVPGVDPWVPLRLEERLEFQTRSFEESVAGKATYTNHRVFRTSGRIVGANR
jgi:hypothetical protein